MISTLKVPKINKNKLDIFSNKKQRNLLFFYRNSSKLTEKGKKLMFITKVESTINLFYRAFIWQGWIKYSPLSNSIKYTIKNIISYLPTHQLFPQLYHGWNIYQWCQSWVNIKIGRASKLSQRHTDQCCCIHFLNLLSNNISCDSRNTGITRIRMNVYKNGHYHQLIILTFRPIKWKIKISY